MNRKRKAQNCWELRESSEHILMVERLRTISWPDFELRTTACIMDIFDWMLIRKFVIYVWNVSLGVFSHILTFSHQHLLSCSSPGLRSYPFYSSSISTPFSSITYLIPDQVSTVLVITATTHPYQRLLFPRAQKVILLKKF